MALATSTIAGIGLAIAAGGAVMSYQQQRQAANNSRRAAEEQRNINAQTQAQNAQERDAERRRQFREERVRRHRIMQSARNTGTQHSSGELGALGNLSTNLSTNIGANLGSNMRAGAISAASQRQADFLSSAQRNQSNASLWGQVSSFGGSLFQAGGGYGAFITSEE